MSLSSVIICGSVFWPRYLVDPGPGAAGRGCLGAVGGGGGGRGSACLCRVSVCDPGLTLLAVRGASSLTPVRCRMCAHVPEPPAGLGSARLGSARL